MGEHCPSCGVEIRVCSCVRIAELERTFDDHGAMLLAFVEMGCPAKANPVEWARERLAELEHREEEAQTRTSQMGEFKWLQRPSLSHDLKGVTWREESERLEAEVSLRIRQAEALQAHGKAMEAAIGKRADEAEASLQEAERVCNSEIALRAKAESALVEMREQRDEWKGAAGRRMEERDEARVAADRLRTSDERLGACAEMLMDAERERDEATRRMDALREQVDAAQVQRDEAMRQLQDANARGNDARAEASQLQACLDAANEDGVKLAGAWMVLPVEEDAEGKGRDGVTWKAEAERLREERDARGLMRGELEAEVGRLRERLDLYKRREDGAVHMAADAQDETFDAYTALEKAVAQRDRAMDLLREANTVSGGNYNPARVTWVRVPHAEWLESLATLLKEAR